MMIFHLLIQILILLDKNEIFVRFILGIFHCLTSLVSDYSQIEIRCVIHFWDILGHFGTFRDISEHFWAFQDILGHFGTLRTISKLVYEELRQYILARVVDMSQILIPYSEKSVLSLSHRIQNSSPREMMMLSAFYSSCSNHFLSLLLYVLLLHTRQLFFSSLLMLLLLL